MQAATTTSTWVGKGKNGIASSSILNHLFKEPNARSTIILRDEWLRLKQLLLILYGVAAPLIQVVPHTTIRRQKIRFGSISGIN
jgi:hypothetical protein